MLKLDRLCHRNRTKAVSLKTRTFGTSPPSPPSSQTIALPSPSTSIPPSIALCSYPSLWTLCTFLPSYLGRLFAVRRSLAHTGTSYGRLVAHSADSLISLPLSSYRAFFVHSFEGISGLVWFWDTLVVLGCVCDHSVDLCFASAIQVCPPCSVVPPHRSEDAYLKICLCCTSYSLSPRFGALLQ